MIIITLIVTGLLDDVFIKTQENNRPDQFKLFLNHKVIKIKWTGVETTSTEPVEIICSNGQTFKCNHVVNTMPVSKNRFFFVHQSYMSK